MSPRNAVNTDKAYCLASAPPGARVKIVRVDACSGALSRLTAMGFVPGAELEVLRNGRPGPFVVLVRGARVILGRGMAKKISVSP